MRVVLPPPVSKPPSLAERLKRRIGQVIGPLGVVAAVWWLMCQAGVQDVAPRRDRPALALAQGKPGPSDWPGWRGPSQQGWTHEAVELPVRWSSSESPEWLTTVPGKGASSPCVWGDAVYLTAVVPSTKSLTLFCFDRAAGQLVWQKELATGDERGREAAATPACDGQLVFVPYVQQGWVYLAAVDLHGKLKWRSTLGPYSSSRDLRTAPIVSGSLVYVAVDDPGTRLTRWRASSTLSAVHRQTGELVWRFVRPCAEGASVPIAAILANRHQVVLPERKQIVSYDAETGQPLWSCQWAAARAAGSVVFDEHHVYASTAEADAETLCVRADGTGDVSDSHVVWRERRFTAEGAWPTLAGPYLVLLGRQGSVTALDKMTGRLVWQKRLAGDFDAPPVLARQRLYCTSRQGTMFVVDTSRRGEILAENALGSSVVGAPAFSGNNLIIRGEHHLWLLAPPSTGEYAAEPAIAPRKF